MGEDDDDKSLLLFFSVLIFLITTVGGSMALDSSNNGTDHNLDINSDLMGQNNYSIKEIDKEKITENLNSKSELKESTTFISKKYTPVKVQAAPESTSEDIEIVGSPDQLDNSSPAKWSLNGTKTVYLTSDNIIDKNTDMKFLKRVKSNLESNGIEVIMDPIAPNPNQVPRSIKNAPKDSVIVVINYNCAGTIKDLTVGISGPETNGKTEKGYLYEYAKDLNGIIYVNVSPDIILTNCSYLPRAWDDVFSPESFEGLNNPAQCLLDNGITLIDDIQPLHPIMGMERADALSNRLSALLK